jgi:hypothetical protein
LRSFHFSGKNFLKSDANRYVAEEAGNREERVKPFQIALRTALIIMGAACLSQAQQAPTPSPREQLNQYVADLRKNPADDALREKIIKLALMLNPKPAVPEEATVAAAKGKTIFTHASDTGSHEDLKVAADAFAKASLLAPWVPDYYFNEAAALEKAGQFDNAVRALNFYLMAAPNAPDAGEVRGRIEGINYQKQKESSLCADMHQAYESAYQDLESRGMLNTTVKVAALEYVNGWRMQLEDIGWLPNTHRVAGHFGWQIYCPSRNQPCGQRGIIQMGQLYPAHVNGEELISITVGGRVINIGPEATGLPDEPLAFPESAWSREEAARWSNCK